MACKKILYVRSGPYKVNLNGYNLQEIGLGKAFCRKGYDVDILYYSDENKVQELETKTNNHLRILWSKGIRLLRSGVYPSILKKSFLDKYDIVMISEYSQIMAVLLSNLHHNVYVYNGPYYNLFKLSFMECFYDKIFVKKINRQTKMIFCKTKMAEDYLVNKGFTRTQPVGVGLDTDNYHKTASIDDHTQDVIDKMKDRKNVLYVGSISKRKNVELTVKAFINYLQNNLDDKKSQLVIIGKGSKSYTNYCKSLIPKDLRERIIWIEFLKNAQLKYIYQRADVFLLPSKQEIFGMVLLEAMYFGVPVIASLNAGSDTLITDSENGFIIKDENIQKWSAKINLLLTNEDLAKSVGKKATQTIKNEFTWDNIAAKMEKEFKC